ncbi:glycoside hydrolase domain-containing protein [Clostridium sp. CCUG 7971]|uniref:glycoside hydrolase domain-containing protein n=1 Tax=Clostridium sp. CCUG 7971 TaxID=2811414 RepID=UPI001ABB019C|nr:glycoside hydrolase domain-containing protein [Clostridium sp. CCUG 7971]MBO3444972.1 DUF1906 domain-containing protein [Clostridium sp. CCUG 7971]
MKEKINANARFDQMVYEVQQYLNEIYFRNAHWVTIDESGKTGWPTIRGLIRALQIEIGISTPNGNFGPATEAACPTLKKNLNPNEHEKRLVYILQGAMWCKGFSPGGFTGTFGDKTEAGIKKFQENAGLAGSDVNGIASKMIMKALLNMDAFVLVPGGDSKIREIQQALNRDYHKWIGLQPTDGRYGRYTNKALIYALQVEGKIAQPNGVLGPATQASLPTLAPGSKNTTYVRIMQYCLYCNGFDPTGFTGVFGNNTLSVLKRFQEFSLLVPDGYCGKQTWLSLLISYGDKDRKGEAFDCSTPITQARANTLKANGYKYAGRYIAGGMSKRITIEELGVIFRNGMKWFPIFQKSGNKLGYFNATQGRMDAEECLLNAVTYKIPSGSTIYFAVDFDAMDGEVTTNILPYFKAIKQRFDGHNPRKYKIGIYGARNICTRVSEAGYAVTSFVSDMSSGFSGNLGYPLPKNWAFDQIKEYVIGSGDGAINIDNDLYSGRDKCVDHMAGMTFAEIANGFFKIFGISADVPDSAIDWEKTIDGKDYKIVLKSGTQLNVGSGPMLFTLDFKDKKLEFPLFDNILGMLSWIPLAKDMKNFIGELGEYMGEGSISIGYTYDKDDFIGLKIEAKINLLKVPEFADVAEIAEAAYFSITVFPKGFKEELKEFVEIVKNLASNVASALLLVLILFIFLNIGGIVSAAGVALSEIIAALTAIIGMIPAFPYSDTEEKDKK